MSSQETILFVAVIALGLALVVVVVGPKLKVRGARRSRRGDPGGVPAAAQGMVEPGAPHATGASPSSPLAGSSQPAAAEATVALPPPPPPAASGHLTCPTCRRTFSSGLRFCPYDARLLTVDIAGIGEHQRSAEPDDADAGSVSDGVEQAAGKICPTCARRYELGAVVCARDGAALVSVN